MSRPPGDDPVAAQIRAEIDDHLVTSAQQLQSQGLAADQARRLSQEKFGDPADIGRRCYWIKQGDTLMFRTAVILLLAALCLALGFTTVSSWRSQRQMAQQVAALTEQLRQMAEQKISPPAPAPAAEPKPLEITGKVYLGTPDKPAAGAEVMICQAFNGEPVRRLITDANGSFQSAPIAPGDYTLIVSRSDKPPRGVQIQTRPLYVYPATPHAEIEIDAQWRTGAMAVELSRPLPRIEVPGKFIIDSRLCLALSSNAVRMTRWNTTQPNPDGWPIFLKTTFRLPFGRSEPNERKGAPHVFRAVLSNEDIQAGSEGILLDGELNVPAGPCIISATVIADVLPHDFQDVPSRGKLRNNSFDTRQVQNWLSPEYVLQESMGAVLMGKLSGMKQPSSYELKYAAASPFLLDGAFSEKITISPGGLTRLRIELPESLATLETQIQELVDSAKSQRDLANALRESNPFIHRAKVTVAPSERQ